MSALLAVDAQVPGRLSLYNVVVFVHVATAVVGFGGVFALAVLFRLGLATEPRSMPLVHRAQAVIGGRIVSGALAVMLVAGLYLAAAGPYDFSEPFVGEGILAILLIGSIGGAYLAPRERRLLELSRRDIEAAGEGSVRFGGDYLRLARQEELAVYLVGAIVLVTILFMVFKPGT